MKLPSLTVSEDGSLTTLVLRGWKFQPSNRSC